MFVSDYRKQAHRDGWAEEGLETRRRIRHKTVENCLRLCQSRGSVTRCEVDFRATHLYAEALDRAGMDDHNRKRTLKMLTTRVLSGLADMG